ncbi:Retrovirus-related Pol polyprotein, partial [Mucuna pruriens]
MREKEMMVNMPLPIKYVEGDEEALETSFQTLEIVGTTSVKGEKGIPKPFKVAIMAAKILISNGFEPGKGVRKKLHDITKLNLGQAGLGYNEMKKKRKPGSKVPGKQLIKLNLYQYFSSGGIMILEQVAAVENQLVESIECVHPMAQELNNWTAETLPESVSQEIKGHEAEFKNNKNDAGKHSRQEEEQETKEETLRVLKRLLEQEGPKLQSSAEELEVINLNEGEEVKEIRVGKLMLPHVKQGLTELLREYADIFAWSYRDMPGLDTTIVEHKLPLNPDAIPIRQQLRRMKPEVDLKIKEEVEKQWNAGFLAVAHYPKWVANIVPVPKKDGKIRMALEDKKKTTFIITWGTFCYKVMLFGLNNAGATYQRAMVTLFHDMIHKEVEVYMDDMITKSKTPKQHINDLQKLFERLRKYRLRLNPAKCTFEVRMGKLLGFIVNKRGIELDPDKVKVIRNIPAPKSEKEVRGLLGRFNYIARFISQLTATCSLMFKLLRKN